MYIIAIHHGNDRVTYMHSETINGKGFCNKAIALKFGHCLCLKFYGPAARKAALSPERRREIASEDADAERMR